MTRVSSLIRNTHTTKPIVGNNEFLPSEADCSSLLKSSQTCVGKLDAIIPMITRKVLTEQLRELEEDGIIIRNAFNEIPPRVEYSLSKQGLQLHPIFQNIMDRNILHEGNTMTI